MRFHSKPLDEHAEVPLADDGRLEALVRYHRSRENPQRTASAAGNVEFTSWIQPCNPVREVQDR